jgi:hypothetical protein
MLGLAVLVMGPSCEGDGPDQPICDRPATFEKSPGPALAGPGWHRIYIQGSAAAPGMDGRFGMSEQRAEVVSGDHFLLSAGALAEWTYPVETAISGRAFLHIARVDDPGVVARYELALIHGAETISLVGVDDAGSGDMGYVPFEECFFAPGADGEPGAGDHLLLRVTNLSGGMLGVVTRSPDYFTWVDLEVR